MLKYISLEGGSFGNEFVSPTNICQSRAKLHFRLCNACYLRWRNIGRPSEGFSYTLYPPNGVIPASQTGSVAETKTKKQKARLDKHVTSTTHSCKETHAEHTRKMTVCKIGLLIPYEATSKEERSKMPSVDLYENHAAISGCHLCLSAMTLLWRRGPLGQRT